MNPITQKQIDFVKRLEQANLEGEVEVMLNMQKYSVDETTWHYGHYEDREFSITAYTNWKRSTLHLEIDVDEFITLLKDRAVCDISSKNLPSSVWIEESSDGDIDFDDFEIENYNEEEEIDFYDLYWDSEINDSEINFEEGAIWGMEVVTKDRETISYEE